MTYDPRPTMSPAVQKILQGLAIITVVGLAGIVLAAAILALRLAFTI